MARRLTISFDIIIVFFCVAFISSTSGSSSNDAASEWIPSQSHFAGSLKRRWSGKSFKNLYGPVKRQNSMVIDDLPSGVVYVASGEGTVYKMVTVPYFMLLNSSQTNGQFMMMKGIINVGEGPPVHIHTREDEVFYVLEGKLEFQIGNDTVHARKGATLYAPRGVRHVFRNPGPDPARLQFFFSPGGIEGYFREASRYLTEDPPNFAKATAVGDKYGVKFFGKPTWSG